MDYCVNCAARGNIKFHRATSSWMKLIKSKSFKYPKKAFDEVNDSSIQDR